MVSEEPRPDRCGARCTDKLGATITLGTEPELTLTDESVAICRFVDTDTDDVSNVVETRANYKTLRKWLWSDYVLDAVGLDPDVEFGLTEQEPGPVPSTVELEACDAIDGIDVERPPTDEDLPGPVTYQSVELAQGLDRIDADSESELVWVDINGSASHNVTNRYNELQGYCEHWPMHDRKRCNNHSKVDPKEMEGNDRAKGTANGMKHGLYARRTNYYQALDEEDQLFVEGMVDSWLEDAPFDRDNAAKLNELYRIAIDQHRAMNALDEYVEDGELEGMTKEVTVDYDPDTGEITALDEHPVNLPYSRLDRDIVKKLGELNILDSNDIDEETTESIAKLLSAGADAS